MPPCSGPRISRRGPVPEEGQHAQRGGRPHDREHQAAQAGQGQAGLAGSRRWRRRSGRRSRFSRAKLRTTRTPARLVCSTSLSLPSASWLARVRLNIWREKLRVSEDHDRHHHQRDQGEPAADAHHDLQGAGEGEHDVGDVEDAEAEQQPHLLQVAGRAAHDLARGHGPVKGGPQPVQPGQQQRAQLVLGVAPRVEDEPAAGHPGDEGQQGQQEDEGGRPGDPLGRAPEDLVDGGAGQPVDAVQRELEHRQHDGPRQVAGQVPAELSAEGDRQGAGVEVGSWRVGPRDEPVYIADRGAAGVPRVPRRAPDAP